MMMLRQTARTVSRCSPTQHSAALAPTGARRLASHGAQYNEPTGRLFGEQPPAPGTKRTKDDWENIYYWGMGSSLVLAIVLGFYGPRTSWVHRLGALSNLWLTSCSQCRRQRTQSRARKAGSCWRDCECTYHCWSTGIA